MKEGADREICFYLFFYVFMFFLMFEIVLSFVVVLFVFCVFLR